MRWILVWLFFLAISVTCIYGQVKKNVQINLDSSTATLQKDSQPKSISGFNNKVAKKTAIKTYNKHKSVEQIFKDLNKIFGHLEILNKQNDQYFDTSTNIFPHHNIPKEKSNVVLRLKIENIDSSSNMPLICKLIIDSVSYSNIYFKKNKDKVKYIDVRLIANDKELLLKLKSFKNNSANSVNNKVIQDTAKSNDNYFLKVLPYLLAVLMGIIILAWILNHFRGKSIFNNTLLPATVTSVNPNNDALTIDRPITVSSEMHPQAPQILTTDSTPVSSYKRYFLTEIMISAGPRKKYISDVNADKDLGEDICGFLSNGNSLLLWLLDGTSDQFCLKHPVNNREYFSSRLMAQGISNKMRSAFSLLNNKNIAGLIIQCIEQVKQDWLKAIDNLPDEEKDLLKVNILNKNIPECSTTLLFGYLSIEGNLVVYRSGDSKVFLYGTISTESNTYVETALVDKNKESNDRLFFRLVLDAEGKFDILFNKPMFEIINQQNIQTMIAFSDGIGMETESLLRKQNFSEETRNEIMFQVQGTADDKSICFVEIREENNHF